MKLTISLPIVRNGVETEATLAWNGDTQLHVSIPPVTRMASASFTCDLSDLGQVTGLVADHIEYQEKEAELHVPGQMNLDGTVVADGA